MEKYHKVMLRNNQSLIINDDRFEKLCKICSDNSAKFVVIDSFLFNIVDIVCIIPVKEKSNINGVSI